MLFRAMFWIGVVALLMPGAARTALPGTSARNGDAATGSAGGLRSMLFERLATVRMDIEAAERSRERAGP